MDNYNYNFKKSKKINLFLFRSIDQKYFIRI